MSWRFVPLVGILLLFAIAGCWRPWLQRRRTGRSGVFLFRAGNLAQKVRDGGAVVLFTLLLAHAAVAVVRPDKLSPLVARPAADVLGAAGAVLMFGGLVLLVIAQLHLGASWRVGIDERARPGLVTGGLYGWSRNPIFLGLIVFVTGYALLLPTPLSLLALAAFSIGVRHQVSAEENYLVRAYGDAYRDYARRVGRFVPGLGRLKTPRGT
jgi:protein-S-isoprenylcysteine O-methyltransferase Ste14